MLPVLFVQQVRRGFLRNFRFSWRCRRPGKRCSAICSVSSLQRKRYFCFITLFSLEAGRDGATSITSTFSESSSSVGDGDTNSTSSSFGLMILISELTPPLFFPLSDRRSRKYNRIPRTTNANARQQTPAAAQLRLDSSFVLKKYSCA